MSGSQILRLIPQTITAESADADDVKTDCGHQAHCDPMTGNVNCHCNAGFQPAPAESGGQLTRGESGKKGFAMVKLRKLFARLGFGVGLLMIGCSQPTLGKWEGPEQVTATKVTQWAFGEEKAKLLESKHYNVYTTIKEDEVLDLLQQVM